MVFCIARGLFSVTAAHARVESVDTNYPKNTNDPKNINYPTKTKYATRVACSLHANLPPLGSGE